LFNKAEDNIEKGIEMWEEMEEQRLKNRSNMFSNYIQTQLRKCSIRSDKLFEEIVHEPLLLEVLLYNKCPHVISENLFIQAIKELIATGSCYFVVPLGAQKNF
ncbi:hypothetical protein ACJX0J_026987, partial [Zea mays]